MKQIILYKTGSISATDKAALKVAGYLPVACKELSDVALLFPDGQRLKGDEIFQAAISSLMGANSGGERQAFGTFLLRSLAKKSEPDRRIGT